jgi:hypothetical protein
VAKSLLVIKPLILISIILMMLIGYQTWIGRPQPIEQVGAYFDGVAVSTLVRVSTASWQPLGVELWLSDQWGVFPIEERVVNGNFKQDLAGWESRGEVVLVEDPAILADLPPELSSSAVQLGSKDQPGWLGENELSQIILAGRGPLRSVSFWYRVISEETEWGFDNPGFRVLLGEKPLFQVSAFELLPASNWPLDSGWQYMSILVTDYAEPVRLSFQAGNTGDLQATTYALVAGVTTSDVALSSQAALILTNHENMPVTYYYSYVDEGGVEQVVSSFGSSHQVQLDQPASRFQFNYWLETVERTSSIPHEITMRYVGERPAGISSPALFAEGNGEASLVFSTPPGIFLSRASRYDIRYGLQPVITDQDWGELPLANVQSHQPLKLTPKLPGSLEDLLLTDFPSGQFYIFVSLIDAAGQYSDYSHEPLFFDSG